MRHFRFLAVATTLMLSSFTWAGGNGGSPKGQPFINLQQQIDQISQELDDLAAEVGVTTSQLQADVATLQSELSSLQSQIKANAAEIAALQAATGDNATDISALETSNAQLQSQINDLNSELASKQDVLDPAGGCAEGSTLRVIYPDGSFLCEVSGAQQNIVQLRSVSAYRYLDSYYRNYSLTASCPSGWIATGGGAENRNGTRERYSPTISESKPAGTSGWQTTARRGYPQFPTYFRTVAICVRNAE